MSTITLNARQLRAALDLVNPDADDPDQQEAEVCIHWCDARKSTEGDDMPAGYYAWDAEYPEEGCILLDPDSTVPGESGERVFAPLSPVSASMGKDGGER